MKDAGQRCLAHEDCASGYCKAGKCSHNVLKKPCAGREASCPPGSICNPISKYCLLATYRMPTSCANQWNCPWNQYCDETSKSCLPKIEGGKECLFNRQCEDGFICAEKQCRKKCFEGSDCPLNYECRKEADSRNFCQPLDEGDVPPEILPVYVIIPIIFGIVLLLIWFIFRCFRRAQPKLSTLPNDRPILPPELAEPTPIKPEATPELITSKVWQENVSSPDVIIPKIVRLQDPDDLPVWTEANVKLPDPFDDRIPSTPVERTEFSSPLNIAAPPHTGEIVRATRLPDDPSMDTSKVWE